MIAGHLGWVRCIAMDVSNEWFATGSADRTIKVWDLASGNLKLTLTGHSHTVRGVAISSRSPYLFSCGEDKAVKCWDLERNEVSIRSICDVGDSIVSWSFEWCVLCDYTSHFGSVGHRRS